MLVLGVLCMIFVCVVFDVMLFDVVVDVLCWYVCVSGFYYMFGVIGDVCLLSIEVSVVCCLVIDVVWFVGYVNYFVYFGCDV